nr:hypothetical protein [Brevundimonas aurantiaca]
MADTATSAPIQLGQQIKAAGPVADPAAAERLLETLAQAADADGWRDTLTRPGRPWRRWRGPRPISPA